MALTKADMAESLFNELGLNKREARELVDMYFEELRASLAVGEQVKLSGSGILIFGIKKNVLEETRKPDRKFQFALGAW
jgi:nucleoid DNA-binding protein